MIADVFCSPGGAAQLSSIMEEVPSWWRSAPCICANSAGLHKEVRRRRRSGHRHRAGRSYKEIKAEAVVQLAKLTMAAELERAQLASREQELNSRT